jgi:hypothetical protein
VTKARLVAHLLAKRFMVEGKMAVVPQRIGSPEEGMQLAASKNKEEAWQETAAFGSLMIQAVGFRENGAKAEVVVGVSWGSDLFAS